jgi:plastocyanin
VFNAASKLYFAAAAVAIVLGFGFVLGTSDRVGFTTLVFAGLGALVLGLAAFVFVPTEPIVALADEPAEARPVDTTDTAGASNWPILGALALGLLAAGLSVERWLLLAGIVVGLITAFGWLGQVWQEHPSWTQDMVDRVNNRFVVPFGLPGTIFLLVGIGVVSLSRLLLALPRDVDPFLGAAVACAVLGTFFLLSTRPIARPATASLAVVAVGLVLAAGVAGALLGERKFGEEGGAGTFEVAAENVDFSTDAMDFPAETEVTLTFDNKEAIPHNWALYESKGGKPIFQGPIVNGPASAAYKFTTPAAGSYYFQCDVHPDQMNGTVNVSADASGKPADTNATTTSTTTS